MRVDANPEDRDASVGKPIEVVLNGTQFLRANGREGGRKEREQHIGDAALSRERHRRLRGRQKREIRRGLTYNRYSRSDRCHGSVDVRSAASNLRSAEPAFKHDIVEQFILLNLDRNGV